MGVDFYSESASTFVISNCKKINTAVDIATELCQIAGRQRLDINPFRRHIFFIFNTTKEEVSEAEFRKVIDEKKEYSRIRIKQYQELPTKFKAKARNELLAISRTIGNETFYLNYNEAEDSFEYNQLAELSDMLSF